MKEEWRDIKGYEGKYQVSNLGRVKVILTNKIKVLEKSKNGYIRVSLYKHNKLKHWLLHRLVITTFNGESEEKRYVDHIDGNPENNILSNLRWCTMKENALNPITRARKSLSKRGHTVSEETRRKIAEKNKKGTKPSKYFTKVECIETGKTYISMAEAGRKTGTCRTSIKKCLQKTIRVANGYHWRYANE